MWVQHCQQSLFLVLMDRKRTLWHKLFFALQHFGWHKSALQYASIDFHSGSDKKFHCCPHSMEESLWRESQLKLETQSIFRFLKKFKQIKHWIEFFVCPSYQKPLSDSQNKLKKLWICESSVQCIATHPVLTQVSLSTQSHFFHNEFYTTMLSNMQSPILETGFLTISILLESFSLQIFINVTKLDLIYLNFDSHL